MRSYRRRLQVVPALLCAIVSLVARPAEAFGDGKGIPGRNGTGTGGDSGLSAQVVQLYEDAALATERYEAGRKKAEAQRVKALRIEALLERERREIDVLHEDLGRIARAQYRSSGGVPLTVQIILASSPDQLMRGQHVFSQTNLAVTNAIEKSRRAEARLARDEARAAAAWQSLEKRNTELAELKKGIEDKLEGARWQLQGQADASVAAGSCPGAVRLDQKETGLTRAWVTPVESYELSAAFGSGGLRWANRHTGQDFAVPIGTPVRAVGDGRVVKVTCGGAFGMEIVVGHAGGYYTQYAHLASVAVDQGERVETGQWIGQSGTTGNSTGPHLHFEVRITPEMGTAVDPVPWLTERGATVG
ncbi:peptidase M23 [Streptomyces viridochromogenes]|uniref:Peptidase M23 n=1 Tax=Streptomyces viridochromogenes TaxID=1938 RepID=A0A0J7YWR7_STRVR|nr:M23 family metallopeptidase [Streptomyces viridochromogenes]KMS68086.1 peptidase M23 [Streptomyces viridochromogenes]KOG07836.1 peptidase M23 [Streptomyces viridochromogenes]KOG28406.1 peptidase M23 [Streptomyces viridochromogenes]